jgi:hypothetical protein
MLSARSLSVFALVAALALPMAARAQASVQQEQERLEVAHSAVQKTGLATLLVTGALGVTLLANKETLFSDGLCAAGRPAFGEFGCNGGLSVLHFAFAATTLVAFVTSEILAEAMPVGPYDTLDPVKGPTMRTIRWVNVGLFAAQPVIGLIAAHPGIIGIPKDARPMFSRVMRTIHLGVGLGVASGYTVNALLQW